MSELAIGIEYLAFKSTVDWLARQVRDELAAFCHEPGLQVSEVEDVGNFETVLKQANAAVVYRLTQFVESPRRPRFYTEFSIGVKTRADDGNGLMSHMITGASSIVGAETRFDVKNYRPSLSPELTPKVGSAFITFSTVSHQDYDKQAGVRFILCRAMAVIYGNESQS